MKTITILTTLMTILLMVPYASATATISAAIGTYDTEITKGSTFTVPISVQMSGSNSTSYTVTVTLTPSSGLTCESSVKTISFTADGIQSTSFSVTAVNDGTYTNPFSATASATGLTSSTDSTCDTLEVIESPVWDVSLSGDDVIMCNGESVVVSMSFDVTSAGTIQALLDVPSGLTLTSGSPSINYETVTTGSSSWTLQANSNLASSNTVTLTMTSDDPISSTSNTLTITKGNCGGDDTPGDSTSPGSGPSGAPGLPPATEDEEDDNVTTQKQKKQQKPEKVTASNRPDIVPGVGLRNNLKLQAALAKVLGQAKMSDKARENMLRLSAAITPQISTERNFEATNKSSKITTKMKYNGNRKAKNFIVYEKIPKSFAESADEITVNTNGRVEIVENDPEYAIVFSELNPGQSIDISYTVNKKVDASVIDAMATEVYAESIEELPAGAQPITTTQPEDKGTSPVLIFIIILVLVAVAGYIIMKKRQKKQEPFRPGPAQQPEEEKPETSSEEIDEVKDKITD